MNVISGRVNEIGLCEVCTESLNRVTNSLHSYIAFGDWTDTKGEPCVWFNGGSNFTDPIQNAPKMRFNIFGECNIVFYEWMNCYNCPNAYNQHIVRQIQRFVQQNLPLLYLVHCRYLDKEDAAAYFAGAMDWNSLLSSAWRLGDVYYTGLAKCDNNADLHQFCVSHGLYGAEEAEAKPTKALLCEELLRHRKPVFDIEYDGEYETLVEYCGNQENVQLPPQIQRIDDLVFYKHEEIKTIQIPASVSVIGWDVFYGCQNVTIICDPGSAAEEYAKRGSICYRYERC